VAHLVKQDADAPLETKWLDSVGTGWTDTSLHHVVEKPALLVHLRTKMQMKGCEGGPYWLDTRYLTVTVKAEVIHLNDA
jgi:hypothetical protein